MYATSRHVHSSNIRLAHRIRYLSIARANRCGLNVDHSAESYVPFSLTLRRFACLPGSVTYLCKIRTLNSDQKVSHTQSVRTRKKAMPRIRSLDEAHNNYVRCRCCCCCCLRLLLLAVRASSTTTAAAAAAAGNDAWNEQALYVRSLLGRLGIRSNNCCTHTHLHTYIYYKAPTLRAAIQQATMINR